jgi:flagellar protein FlaG
MVTSVQPQAAAMPQPEVVGGGLGKDAAPIPGKGQLQDLVKIRPPVGESASEQPGAQATKVATEKAAQEIGKSLSKAFQNFQVSVDNVLNRPVVKVVDANSGNLIIQVPSEEAVRISHRLESLSGVLLKGKA